MEGVGNARVLRQGGVWSVGGAATSEAGVRMEEAEVHVTRLACQGGEFGFSSLCDGVTGVL